MTFPETIQFAIQESTRFVSPPAVAAEWVITAAAGIFVAAISLPKARRLRDAFHRLANRKRAAILICGVLPICLRLALLPWMPVPDPSIHDEFSHLLLADTLAHGRLSNPTHPMWRHFETIHVIQKPTYSSMYPPAQDSLPALGEVLFHEPWAGVLMSAGLMCAAACWMMQGWLPPAWALFGGLIVVLKIGVQGFFMNSFIGGAVPAIAGALLMGSVPRLKNKEFSVPGSMLFGISLALLMNTRPFEGGVLAAAAAAYLLPALRYAYRENRTVLVRKVAVPAASVLFCAVLFTGYYNWRVTRKPLHMGYQVNRETYGWPENLAFLPAKKIALKDKVLQSMYLKEVNHRTIYATPTKFLDNLATRLFDNWTFFLGPLLTVPLVFLPCILRDPKTAPLAVAIALIAFLNLFQMVLYPFHLGPVVPAIYAVVTAGFRYLYLWLARAGTGRAFTLAATLPVCLVLIGTMKQAAGALNLPLAYWEIAAEPHREQRAYIADWLAARPKKQLVIVRYDPWHLPDQEWVYNGADVDGSKVVWAREIDPESDAELVRYFAGREAWRLNADVYPPRLLPYVPGK